LAEKNALVRGFMTKQSIYAVEMLCWSLDNYVFTRSH